MSSVKQALESIEIVSLVYLFHLVLIRYILF